MEQGLVKLDQQSMVAQVKKMWGGEGGSKMPFIPKLKVNNKETEEEATIGGKLTKVKVPASKGFLITKKIDNEYKTEFFSEELEGVILKIRWSISSRQKVEPKYYSYEFDYFTQEIQIYGEGKQELFKGTYKQIKEHFKTGEKNTFGGTKWSGQLSAVVYVNVAGTLYRLQVSSSGIGPLIEYSNTFGDNETPVGCITKFNLEYITEGAIKFWALKFERGEQANLEDNFSKLKELEGFFHAVDKANTKVEEYDQPEYVEATPYHKDEEINVEDIPF